MAHDTASPWPAPASRPLGGRHAERRLRVLVTNPWNGQAYCTVRALRPRAARLVATRYEGHGLLGRLAPAAVSRFTDAVYPVPLAVRGWQRGEVADENSPVEERFVRSVLDICARERLDVVFPTWDPEVCLLSRNKARFTAQGITVPVPEWPVLRATMDKYAIARLASDLGVPCPRTYHPAARGEAAEMAAELGFPLFVKPRFSSGSRGVQLVTGPKQLEATLRRVEPAFGMPVLQEWIPGGLDRRVNINVTLDRAQRPLAVDGRRTLRTVFPSYASVSCATASYLDRASASKILALLQAVGYVGHARAQLKIDARDAVPKLLEINCRLGYRVWCEIEAGLDVPAVAIEIERGGPVAPPPLREEPLTFLNPVEDALSLAVFLADWGRRRLGWHRDDGLIGPPPGLGARLRAYRDTYRAPRRVYDWYFRALGDDPLAGLAWYVTQAERIARLPKRPAG
ncbi:MAG TPA: hypothetical protein VHF87_13520 [Methylomirabilota bacterium]|nr:hypothetical protein [Methylomirabilota bacterium]